MNMTPDEVLATVVKMVPSASIEGHDMVCFRSRDAPDWRSIGDSRARDREYERQQALAASLAALYDGVRYWPNGAPMIPKPLADVLRASDGTVAWPGPIASLDEEIAQLDKKIAEQQGYLDSHLQAAEALLAEVVTS